MAGSSTLLPPLSMYWGDPVASSAALPATGGTGEVRIALDTDILYEFNGSTWQALTSGSPASLIVGPASATDNAIARYDGTTGKLLQNSGVVITDTGFLGVGVTPDAKIHISGAVDFVNGNLKIQSTDSDSSIQTFYARSSGAHTDSRNWELGSNTSGNGNFDIRNSSTSTGSPATNVVAVFSRVGNFGLGLTPTEKFHVTTTDTTIAGLFAGASKSVRIIPQTTRAVIEATDQTGQASFQPLRLGGSTVDFFLSGTTLAMTIAAGGSVGIGIAAPDAALHVKSALDATDGTIKVQSTDNDASGVTMWAQSSGANALSRNWMIAANYTALGDLNIMRSSSSTGAPTVNTVASFNSSGQFGIGIAPTQMMHIYGTNPFILVEGLVGSAVGMKLSANSAIRWTIGLPAATADLSFVDLSSNTSLYLKQGTATAVGFIGIGTASPTTALEVEATQTITGGVTDGYAGAVTLDPGYTAATALTVTRHNYIDVQNVSNAGAGPSAVTDACVMRFDAAAGTHKAVDAATTKTTPGGVDSWLKINVNGAIMYIPAYTSKTA
jgi:hypothetical protein